MKSLLAAMPVILLLGAPALGAQPKAAADEAHVEYLGGLTLCAADPAGLAAWYTGKLGIALDNEYQGMYYGTLKSGEVELNIGIHPLGVRCQKSPSGLALTFRVSDYDGFLKKLAGKGLTPFKTDPPTGYGRFAYFHDPEGNEIAVWGK